MSHKHFLNLATLRYFLFVVRCMQVGDCWLEKGQELQGESLHSVEKLGILSEVTPFGHRLCKAS